MREMMMMSATAMTSTTVATEKKGSSCVVIGAGICGVSTAFFLQKLGYKVTVLERKAGPAMETSFQNGAMICPSVIKPWLTPKFISSLLTSVVKWDSPTQISWSGLSDPALWRWSMHFYKSCMDESKYADNYQTLYKLGMYSKSLYDNLLPELKTHTPSKSAHGTVFFFENKEEYLDGIKQFDTVVKLGCKVEPLLKEQATEREPALREVKDLYGAIFLPMDTSGDIHSFTEALHEKCKDMGVSFVFGESVQTVNVDSKDVKVTSVVTDSGKEFKGDNFVICAGSFSTKLAQATGTYVPIYPVKGYTTVAHVNPGMKNTKYTLGDSAKRVLICPVGDKVHMSSFALFEGHNETYSEEKAGLVHLWASSILPKGFLTPESTHRKWACFRPVTPDDMPVVGAVKPCRNLFINSGHGSKGWTTAIGTSKLLSEIMSGKNPSMDCTPFDPLRFKLF
eukprot:Nk52_evm1s2451 gene=Nk52_evmTU1s2451